MDEEKFMPKSLIMHSVDTIDNIIRDLSVINFNLAYSNHNQAFEGMMKVIGNLEEAIKQNNVDITKTKLELNPDSLYKMKQLWNQSCWLTIENRDISTETIHFDNKKIDFNNPELDIIPIPALDQFDLEQSKRDKSLLLKISELMPLKYAWEGLSWATVVEYGNFKVQTKEGNIPTVTKEDMDSLDISTSDISRHVYNRLIKKYKVIFLKHWYIILNNIQKILVHLKTKGVNEEMMDEYNENVVDDNYVAE